MPKPKLQRIAFLAMKVGPRPTPDVASPMPNSMLVGMFIVVPKNVEYSRLRVRTLSSTHL